MIDTVLSALGLGDQQISNDSQSNRFRISPEIRTGDYETLEVYLSDEPEEFPGNRLLWRDGYRNGISILCRSRVNVRRYRRGESFLCKLVRLKDTGHHEFIGLAYVLPLPAE